MSEQRLPSIGLSDLNEIPKVWYKYRGFNARTIELLCADTVYFADPSTFNDPLDTQPCVDPDCDVGRLENTLYELVRTRAEDSMRAAATAVKYRGPRTMDHIAKHSCAEAQRVIEDARFEIPFATDEENAEDRLKALVRGIELELMRQYNKGVLSLATRFDCPLMWSHYGDQHRGLSIGYSVPTGSNLELHKVQYDGDRNVSASMVALMVLDHDSRARKIVDDAVLLRKAPDWRYEAEWRLLGPQGEQDSPLEMTEIVFGMRCPETVKHTIARALSKRATDVKLYEMHEIRGTFALDRWEMDARTLAYIYPRRAIQERNASPR